MPAPPSASAAAPLPIAYEPDAEDDFEPLVVPMHRFGPRALFGAVGVAAVVIVLCARALLVRDAPALPSAAAASRPLTASPPPAVAKVVEPKVASSGKRRVGPQGHR